VRYENKAVIILRIPNAFVKAKSLRSLEYEQKIFPVCYEQCVSE